MLNDINTKILILNNKLTGITALIIATSCMDSPRDFMCRFRYGYRTVIDADWKKNINLIQIRCFSRKSLNTHLITEMN